MRLFPASIETWLPEDRVQRIALKIVIVGVYLHVAAAAIFGIVEVAIIASR